MMQEVEIDKDLKFEKNQEVRREIKKEAAKILT